MQCRLPLHRQYAVITTQQNQKSMPHLLLGFKSPLKQIHFPTGGPVLRKSKTCKLWADRDLPQRHPVIAESGSIKPQSERAFRRQQVHQGGQLSQKEVDEKEEHQPTSTTPPVLCTTCERQCITTLASLPWNYFPDNDQKNSGSIATVFYMERRLTMWEVVALALKKPAIAPPGKKQKDYSGGERRREDSLQ